VNDLSWFLYLADVVDSAHSKIAFMIITIFLSSIAWAMIGSIERDAENREPLQLLQKKAPLLIGTVILLLALNVALPSKETIYLIAGSEAGEYVVTSPEGQEIINDIRAILKSQIEELE